MQTSSSMWLRPVIEISMVVLLPSGSQAGPCTFLMISPPPPVRTGSWEGHTMPTMVILVLCKGLRIWFSDWQKLEELSSGLQRHSGRPHKTGLLWCQVPHFLLWVFSLLLLFGPWDFLLFGAQLCVQKNRIDPSSLPEPPRSEPVSYHIPF